MSETTNLKLFKQDNPTTNTNNFDIEKTLNENWDKLDENAGTTNKKLESLEKVDSTTNETITAIQEEQTTQNENIEKNAEGIAQNKKDVDEELTKLKEENSLLKSQIPQGTASGNNIHLEDSSNMDFAWKLRCGSWQETRSGKNKFYGKFTPKVKEGISLIVNSDDTILINGTNNLGDLVYTSSTFSLKAGTYIASGMPDGTSLYDVYIQFSYFENEKKQYVTANGNKFTLLEDKDNVVCYIGFKQGKTANNIILKPMLREATIEDDTYEQYGVSPSPEFPSEIENVGENINVFNKTADDFKNGTTIGWAKRIILTLEPNTFYTCSTDDEATPGSSTSNLLFGNTDSNLYTVTKHHPISYKTDLSGNISIYLRTTNIDDFFANYYIKVEKGLRATPNSAYNCGNIEIAICNKNLFDGVFTTNGVWNNDGTINYVIQSKLYWRTDFIKIPNKNIYFSSKQSNIFSSAKLLEFDADKKYIISNKIYQVNSNFNKVSLNSATKFIAIQWDLQKEAEIEDLFTDFQIEVASAATSYIQHQEQATIFPFEEGQKLRSLPNGIKDYLAEDGIHKNVGTMILNGGADEGYNKAVDNKFTLGINTKKGLLLKNLKTDNSKISVLSDKLLGVPWNTMFTVAEGWQIALRQDGNYTYLRLLTTGMEDVKALTTFLQSNNIAIQYPLAEEEIIPYTPKQQAVIDKILYTYKNVTNISVDNELATLDITYKKDIKTMFDNQSKEYNERLTNIENLLNTTSTSALLLDNLESDLEKEV